MNKLVFLTLLSLTACQPNEDTYIDTDNDIEVSEVFWAANDNVKPYPFTTEYGDIACSMNEVYFYPDDSANDESQIGLPLNKLAEVRLKEAKLKPTVANAIKPHADLSEAIRMGLDHCKKVKS